EPDRSAFPCLGLAEEAVRTGGTACAVLNAANEEAVGLYLRDRIGFYDIPRLVSRAMETVPVVQNPTLQDILDADSAARRQVF
ncbi:MAG: 1-deoxy-D-xylulose-5-phosphate reductoisomerase, partial [Oscillibacter sp.]|nr:1-deoxy-D-xylulose-5-phosphate reductoisomerase [Oscillibacter sp.]